MFNLITMVPEDIMHVLFEGACVYEVKLALNNLVENMSFTLDQLNGQFENSLMGIKTNKVNLVQYQNMYFMKTIVVCASRQLE